MLCGKAKLSTSSQNPPLPRADQRALAATSAAQCPPTPAVGQLPRSLQGPLPPGCLGHPHPVLRQNPLQTSTLAQRPLYCGGHDALMVPCLQMVSCSMTRPVTSISKLPVLSARQDGQMDRREKRGRERGRRSSSGWVVEGVRLERPGRWSLWLTSLSGLQISRSLMT